MATTTTKGHIMKLFLILAFALLAMMITPSQEEAGVGEKVITACTLEDGSGEGQTFPCYWDAQTRGNGLGTSFTLYRAP